LITSGCCTCKLCFKCIKTLDSCPMCRKSFFWRDMVDMQYIYHIHKMQCENVGLMITNTHLNSKIEEKDIIITELVRTNQGKALKIKALMDRIDVIDHHLDILIDEKKNKEELERVVQKYNLNII